MFVRSTNGLVLPSAMIAAITMASGTIAGTAHGAPVQWKNSNSVSATKQAKQSPASVLRGASIQNQATKSGGYILVRLHESPDKAARDSMLDDGLELLSPIGDNTYFARVHAGADTASLEGRLSDAGLISRDHKLHPMIQSDEMPSWAIVGGDTVRLNEASDSDPVVAAYVMMHRDVDASSPEMDKLLGSYQGAVKSVVMSMNTLVVEMPYSQLKKLADDDRVQWIEPPLPPLEVTNASNRAITQVNTAQSSPYNLDGTGVTVLVYDGGTVRASHNDFSGRVTNIDSSGVHYHATHVAGTIGGDGSTTLNNRGMAPGVNILAAGFEVAGGLSEGFLYTDPGDLESDYSLALSLGASISNNSIGSNVAQNGYPCAWQGDYGITAGTIDNVIRGSLGDPITVFWAAGNERGSGRCGTSYGTTAPPGNNKNAISIGALNSNDDSMTGFSSWGPSDDGRLRPVLSAPGCQTGSDGGVTSTGDASNTEYITLCGTSMAAPTAAGIGALILQDFRAQYPELGDPSNQLMKVILIEGAEDILNAGPDFQSGYGSIRAVDSIEFMRGGNFDEDSVDQGGSSNYTITVNPDDEVFRVTIAWDDPAGAPNVAPALVNDLDLVVIDPNGVRHYPWTLNPASPSAGAVRTQEDHLNNIEQVFVENPQAGVWQVQVMGTDVTDGPQSFALASSLDLGDGLLSVSLAQSAPELILPNTPIEVTAFVNEGSDSVVPGSVWVNYRNAPGSFTSMPMDDNGDRSYSQTIPGASCGEFIEYFISASGTIAGPMTSPPNGETNPLHTEIGAYEIVLSDNFETNEGWTVSGDAADGGWTRGVPVDCSSRGAPGADSDGSGICWVTDNDSGSSCNSDVDDGTTILTSPVYDMSDGGEFSYDYWFADIPTGEVNGDDWAVDASIDGGSNWTRVRTITTALQAWRSDSIVIGQDIEASATMRFRFSINDIGTQNVIEGGLDNISITRFVCDDASACPADLNNDGSLNFLDVSAFLGAFGVSDSVADFDGNGSFNFLDISAFLGAYNAGCP